MLPALTTSTFQQRGCSVFLNSTLLPGCSLISTVGAENKLKFNKFREKFIPISPDERESLYTGNLKNWNTQNIFD